jgi:hypothetical protein
MSLRREKAPRRNKTYGNVSLPNASSISGFQTEFKRDKRVVRPVTTLKKNRNHQKLEAFEEKKNRNRKNSVSDTIEKEILEESEEEDHESLRNIEKFIRENINSQLEGKLFPLGHEDDDKKKPARLIPKNKMRRRSNLNVSLKKSLRSLSIISEGGNKYSTSYHEKTVINPDLPILYNDEDESLLAKIKRQMMGGFRGDITRINNEDFVTLELLGQGALSKVT